MRQRLCVCRVATRRSLSAIVRYRRYIARRRSLHCLSLALLYAPPAHLPHSGEHAVCTPSPRLHSSCLGARTGLAILVTFDPYFRANIAATPMWLSCAIARPGRCMLSLGPRCNDARRCARALRQQYQSWTRDSGQARDSQAWPEAGVRLLASRSNALQRSAFQLRCGAPAKAAGRDRYIFLPGSSLAVEHTRLQTVRDGPLTAHPMHIRRPLVSDSRGAILDALADIAGTMCDGAIQHSSRGLLRSTTLPRAASANNACQLHVNCRQSPV